MGWVSSFRGHVTDNAMCVRQTPARHVFNPVLATRDERDLRARDSAVRGRGLGQGRDCAAGKQRLDYG